jgi:hypothetical protein
MVRFRAAIVMAGALALSACGSQPPASPSTTAVTTSPATPTGSSIPSSVEPTIPVGLPAELQGIAWSRVTQVGDGAGGVDHATVEIGLLGRLASFETSVDRARWYVTAASGGPYVAMIRFPTAAGDGQIDVIDARTTATLGTVPFKGGTGVDHVLVDPAAKVLYASMPAEKGGIEIVRMAFDGTGRTSLIRLDKRFAPVGIPEDRFGMALTASGTLVAIACGRADGCRVWEVPPGAKAAPPPIRLAANVPVICYVAAASDDVLIVYDPGACSDEGGVPLPVRAIDLGDGSTRLLAREPRILVKRVVDVGGASRAIASVAAGPDAYTIDAIDLETGGRSVLAGPIAQASDSLAPLVEVSPAVLPGAWVLVASPEPNPNDPADRVPAVLIDAAGGTAIQLPVGTFGWEYPVGP